MNLPRSFLDELRTRTSLMQVVGQKVFWDSRKSKPSSGEMWAPCPFHKDNSASFRVDDRKGTYYCFDCHAKGDVFSFIRKTKCIDFIEAVRVLAQEAGMSVPDDDPQGKQPTERSFRKLAYIVCECSCGKTSKLSAEKLAPFLGEELTAANSPSLIAKLRCSECHCEPSQIFDDKKQLIFGPDK